MFKEVSPYSYIINDSVKVEKIRHAFVKLQGIVFTKVSLCLQINLAVSVRAAYSVTMNIFRKKKNFLFKSFVKVELSYVFTIKMSVQLKTAWKSELSHQICVFFSCW